MAESALFKKIYGCIAAGSIGAALGEPARRLGGAAYDPFKGLCGPLEGAHYRVIEESFGKITELLPHSNREKFSRWHNGPLFHFVAEDYPPGMTEDGVERKWLVLKAIQDAGGHIRCEDLTASWLKYVRPEEFGYQLLPRDEFNYENMKRLPPREVGKYDRWPGNVDVLMALHPVGCINAGNPRRAFYEAWDVAQAVQSSLISYAPDMAATICAAIAEAFKPQATVESMLEQAARYADQNVADCISEAIDIAKGCSSWEEMRDPFYDKYGGRVPTDSLEVGPESFAVLYITDADPTECMIAGSNFGRDADCIASIAAAMAGALRGVDVIRQDWIEAVEAAVSASPHTIQDMTMEEQARVLYGVLLEDLGAEKARIAMLEGLN